MSSLNTFWELRDFLYEKIVPEQPIYMYEDSERENAAYYGIFPERQYRWFVERERHLFKHEKIVLILRPGYPSEGARELYGSDLLEIFDDIAEDSNMDMSLPLALVVYDQSTLNNWSTRKFTIGVDTELQSLGDNRFVLLPQLSHWQKPLPKEYENMAAICLG